MKYNPEKHHRRSIRLRGYDYLQSGTYFVTICTQNRVCMFGEIVDGKMRLNNAGRMVEKWYQELVNKFLDIRCDEYIVMPNHFHGVIVNVGADLRVCPGNKPGAHEPGAHIGAPLQVVVQWFKTMTTNEYIRGVKQHDWPRFDGKLWQRNYYEHIIRNENELNRIRQYIIDNPTKWDHDHENPTVGADSCACPDNNTVREPVSEYGREPWMI